LLKTTLSEQLDFCEFLLDSDKQQCWELNPGPRNVVADYLTITLPASPTNSVSTSVICFERY